MSFKRCNKCDLSSNNCVEEALDTIREHFLFIRKELEEKNKELLIYAEHNERLTKVVTFLQCEKKDGENIRKSSNYGRHSKKISNALSECNIIKRGDAVRIDATPPTPTLNLDLNLALNSEQLQDLSDISSTQETIEETEKNSPLKCSLLSARRSLLREVNNETKQKENTNQTKKISGFNGKRGESALVRSKQALKQTKLKFNVKNCETKADVVNGSSNLYSSLQQAKFQSCHRSATDFDYDVTSKNLHKSTIKKNYEIPDANSSENFFDLSKSNFNTPTSLRPNSNQSSSVLLLSPMTQDIVFVDDSQESNCSLDSLKHFEEKIDKKSTKPECSTKRISNRTLVSDINIKEERITQNLDETRLEEDQLTENHKYNVSEGYNLYYQRRHKRKFYEDNQSDDDNFVQPIIVKKESDTPKKKISIKKRFPVCCDDCEKYFTFFGENLSDKQIEDHLQNCKQHKEQERLGHITPPGFWNPLMESFPDGDPRNEVLIHRLFGKKNDAS